MTIKFTIFANHPSQPQTLNIAPGFIFTQKETQRRIKQKHKTQSQPLHLCTSPGLPIHLQL